MYSHLMSPFLLFDMYRLKLLPDFRRGSEIDPAIDPAFDLSGADIFNPSIRVKVICRPLAVIGGTVAKAVRLNIVRDGIPVIPASAVGMVVHDGSSYFIGNVNMMTVSDGFSRRTRWR
jgi:hypothetical protein